MSVPPSERAARSNRAAPSHKSNQYQLPPLSKEKAARARAAWCDPTLGHPARGPASGRRRPDLTSNLTWDRLVPAGSQVCGLVCGYSGRGFAKKLKMRRKCQF
jgi:hypothetical protein